MDRTRGIVLGGGAVGADFHVPRILGILGCESLHIVDQNEARCRVLRNRFAKYPQIHVGSRMPSERFDVGVIATPPKFHAILFQELAGICKQIVIEKPLAISVAEAMSIAKLADEKGCQVTVALIRRTLHNFKLMQSWLQQGTFGRLQSVHVAEGSVFGWNAVSIGSFSKELNGGGVLMDTGPHVLDQLFQTFDSLMLKRAYMDVPPSDANEAVEANVELELVAENDVPVTLLLSRNRIFKNQALYRFENAEVSLALHNNSMLIRSREGVALEGYPQGQTDVSYDEMFDAFYTRFVLDRNNQGVSPEDALRSQRIIEAAYHSAVRTKGSF